MSEARHIASPVLEFCAAVTTTLALPPSYAQIVASALSQKRKPVLVWLEFQDCAGNTESMLRSSHPSVEDIVLETLSWEYHETIMAGYGKAAEAALNRVVREEKGKYLAVVEGAIPTADDGVYCTIGGRTALAIAREVCSSAAANIAVGACAWDGGLVRSNPNPTGALGLQDAVPGLKVVNLPGCPHNSANTAAVLVYYLMFGEMPALDPYNRPHGKCAGDHSPESDAEDCSESIVRAVDRIADPACSMSCGLVPSGKNLIQLGPCNNGFQRNQKQHMTISLHGRVNAQGVELHPQAELLQDMRARYHTGDPTAR